MGKLTLILGGARSGKSTLAERLAAQSGRPVLYIATAQALDEEMTARIAAHRRKRPPEWQTLELPVGVGQQLLAQPPQAGLVLMDCLTLLVSNVVLQAAGMEEQPDEAAATAQVQREVGLLLEALGRGPADWIIVSNEVGLGLVPPYPLGRIYRDLLGWANQQLAQRAAQTLFMIAGLPMQLSPLSPNFKL
jgi:adenosylcobinamide kinase / adenosylcobinamide-phosphate guanylyltransferase